MILQKRRCRNLLVLLLSCCIVCPSLQFVVPTFQKFHLRRGDSIATKTSQEWAGSSVKHSFETAERRTSSAMASTRLWASPSNTSDQSAASNSQEGDSDSQTNSKKSPSRRTDANDETDDMEEDLRMNTKDLETKFDNPPIPPPPMGFSDGNGRGNSLGGFDPATKIPVKREVLVGDPQQRVPKDKEMSVTSILMELAAIQTQGPKKYCVLGTRHCSFLHQQIIELLAYALVLSGNHVYTSGAGGTHAATIRGALRAERPDLLTVVLPQSMNKQTPESQELLKDVSDVVSMPQNDEMGLDVASRICNSYLLSQTDHLISFAFHESHTVIEATDEAQKLDMLVTTLYLD